MRTKKILSKLAAVSLSMALVLSNTITVSADELEAGGAATAKTATAIEGADYTYRIREEIKAKDAMYATGSEDIVLVIDSSASMIGAKMDKAKEAAKEFVNSLLNGQNDIQIAIVGFNVHTTATDYSKDPATLCAAIDALNPYDITNMQEALYVANNIPARAGVQKSIALIGDGMPLTHCKELAYAEEDLEIKHIAEHGHMVTVKSGALPIEYDYTKTTIVDPLEYTGICSECGEEFTDKFINTVSDVDVTYQEANKIKEQGVNIYTVGTTIGYIGESVLKNIQNAGYANAKNIDDLNAILKSIAIQIIDSAGKEAVVTDVLSNNFEYIDGTAKVSLGNVEFDSVNKKFNWYIGDLLESDTLVLEYDIKLKDELKQSSGKYLVSEKNVLNYIAYNGEAKEVPFPDVEIQVEAIKNDTVPTNPTVPSTPSNTDTDKNPNTGARVRKPESCARDQE